MLILTRHTRIDWPRMLENLRRLGMSTQQVADELDVGRSGMDNWASPGASGEPAFWTGARMIEVWCLRTGLKWTDAPVRAVTPSVSEVLREHA